MRKKLAILLIVLALAAAIYAATVTKATGSNTDPNIANLDSLASSATAGWESDVIDNRTTDALDYQILVSLDMADTAPANDEAIYVYIAPAHHDGSNWFFNDSGTATAPDGDESTYTIDSAAGNLVLATVMKYTTQNQVVQAVFRVAPALGYSVGDGFSIIIVNYSGAAISASGNQISYKPITGDVS